MPRAVAPRMQSDLASGSDRSYQPEPKRFTFQLHRSTDEVGDLRSSVPSLGVLSLGRVQFFLRKLRHPIPSGALVVDVGSGGDPHPRANVIVDRQVEAGGERTVAFNRTAPVVVADIRALPFKSKVFGYSLCSHVLEHVHDPVLAAAELQRISAAGYVETPSELHEKMMPIGWHRWFVRLELGRLIFEAKPSPFLDERLGDYFRTRWARDRPLMRYVWSHTADLFVCHEWSGELQVEATPPATWFLPDTEDQWDSKQESPRKRALYNALCAVRYR